MLWYGCLQRMVLFKLSLSTPLWKIGERSHSLMAQNEILRWHQELAFLFGKQLGLGL